MKRTNGKALKFRAENLAEVEKGEFEQKPLTIFCGPNNSGKTWVMYSLYHFYRHLSQVKKEAKKKSLGSFNQGLTKGLPRVFNVAEGDMKNSRFKFSVAETQFQKILKQTGNNVFLMPAERELLHLELNARRNALARLAPKEGAGLDHLLQDITHSSYSRPTADYVDWLNQILVIKKRANGQLRPFASYAKQVSKIVGGAYRVDANGCINFKPRQGKEKRNGRPLGLHLTSSIVKSLFGLWFYLEYQARKGDILMIDEPELSIHPANQIQLARLLAQLVNAGLKVIISTHSDYIVREFNDLIMLDQDHKRTMRKQYKYADNEVLKAAQVGAYLFDEQTIRPFQITLEGGIYATTFDDVIKDVNNRSNDIYYSLLEENESVV